MLIGVCGKSGCGKSTLAKAIAKHTQGGKHIDIDKIGHAALTLPEVKAKLKDAFGDEIFTDDNLINRKKLSLIVFNSPKAMDTLTEITWKHMERIIDSLISENKDKVLVLDWLLLPKTKYFDICDCTILLDIPYKIREQRAVKRDGITLAQFKSRDEASITYDATQFDLVFSDNAEINDKQIMNILQEGY